MEIDHDLMAQALKVGGFKTRKAAVEEGLRLLVRTRTQGRLRGLRGKLRWEGSLEEMRRDRWSSSTPPSGSTISTAP